MTQLAWPLQRNMIRRQVPNNAFGKVRNGGTKDHQGWDLYALPVTPCYAIADGKIVKRYTSSSYGLVLILEFEYQDRKLYAAYCHLSLALVQEGESVKRSQAIGATGNSGNAWNMTGEDQHLHFEIRTTASGGEGLAGRLDPADLYGRAPMQMIVQGHGEKALTAGIMGLKVPGGNVLP